MKNSQLTKLNNPPPSFNYQAPKKTSQLLWDEPTSVPLPTVPSPSVPLPTVPSPSVPLPTVPSPDFLPERPSSFPSSNISTSNFTQPNSFESAHQQTRPQMTQSYPTSFNDPSSSFATFPNQTIPNNMQTQPTPSVAFQQHPHQSLSLNNFFGSQPTFANEPNQQTTQFSSFSGVNSDDSSFSTSQTNLFISQQTPTLPPTNHFVNFQTNSSNSPTIVNNSSSVATPSFFHNESNNPNMLTNNSPAPFNPFNLLVTNQPPSSNQTNQSFF